MREDETEKMRPHITARQAKLHEQLRQSKLLQDEPCLQEDTVKIPKLPCQGHKMQEDKEIDEGGISTTIGTERPQYPIKL